VRHLIFDFFGTLVTYREGIDGNPVERARAELVAYGVEVSAQQLTNRLRECFSILERGANETLREYSMSEAVRALFVELGATPSDDRVSRFVEAYLRDWSDSVRALPRLDSWLDALPMPKSVLSNTHHEPLVLGLIDRLGVGASFDRVTTSIGHGYRKPHPSIYRAHLDALGVAPQDAIFVGDNPQCDYFGPRAVGIEAYLIAPRPVSGIPERHRLAHLYQLGERL
jgi:putative hydrolase of the HAD superfamily